jgi:hypothetical protein
VHAAHLQDRDGAKILLAKARGQFPRLRVLWADGGYAGQLLAWMQIVCQWVLVIVRRPGRSR